MGIGGKARMERGAVSSSARGGQPEGLAKAIGDKPKKRCRKGDKSGEARKRSA